MPYVDLAGLSRYASRQKDRLERDYALLRDMQWTRSEKAGAVSLWPVGGTPLDVSVDFLFTETPPASGDKGPENPSTIEGVNQVNVARYTTNLFNGKNITGFVGNGVTLSISEDGIITLNGTNTMASGLGGRYLPFSPTKLMKFNSGSLKLQAEYISGSFTNGGLDTKAWGFQQSLVRQSDDAVLAYCNITDTISNLQYSYSFTVPVYLGSQYLYTTAGSSFNNFKFRIMVEVSDTYSDIDSAGFDNYSISLPSSFYGGTLDVASGVMTVTHFLEQLSSSTNIVATGFSEGQSAYRVGMYLSSSKERMPYPITSLEGYACNSFPVVADPSTNSAPCFGLAGGSVLTYLCLTKTMLGVGDGAAYDAVRSAVLSFLGSHQIKVAGKLATPYTVQLTPTEILSLAQTDKYTPRLNTIYTDASAVQVGYVKSPIRDEYELTQAITAQGGNV